MGFVIRWLINAVALWVTTLVVPGIDVTAQGTGKGILTILAVALIFGLVNAIIKPIVKTVGCVFYLVTLGLIALVVNALLFLLTDWLAGLLKLPFSIDGFWPAFWGAIVMGVVSWLLSLLVPDRAQNAA
ncbi:phage holin family protein [Allorhizocola rhizosphaerae]|uniref:phage holin family protein n=1 Tax=Allorhizocola rhizosphaerae TaxID=1872709 RepID=UPI000E3DF997|nr:phage holin family protein [Allorhizocola rhizosphaerae]